MSAPLREIRPQVGMQEQAFIACALGVEEMLMGGMAGPGKSYTLLTMDLPDIQKYPKMRVLILRRQTSNIGDLIDKSWNIYPLFGAKFSGSDANYKGHASWTFPNGAKVVFGHMKEEKDKFDYQGWEFPRIRIDELCQFTESQYLYIFSRCRSAYGIPANIASSANPQGIGMLWVMRRFVNRLRALEIKAFKVVNDVDTEVPFDDPEGMTRMWIPGKRSENAYIDATYLRRLNQLKGEDRDALMHGVWKIQVRERQLIDPAWVDRSMAGHCIKPMGFAALAWSLGCDYANTGSDKTKVYYFLGNRLVDIKTEDYSKADIFASWAALEIKKLGREKTWFGIDANGVGSGPADNLEGREQMADRLVRCLYKDVNYKAVRKGIWDFGNLRSQMHWQFRLDLEDGVIDLSWLAAANCSFDRVQLLLEEMYAHTFYERDGKMYISSKKDVKKLINRSPDDYDALVIANWVRHQYVRDPDPEEVEPRKPRDYRRVERHEASVSPWL